MNEPLYTPTDLSWWRENYGETEWLVHVIGPDDILLYSDEQNGFGFEDGPDGTTPFTLTTADEMAKNINAVHERIERDDPSPLNPFLHATVFHYGRPLAAPEDIPAAPGFRADELAFFKKEYGETAWMVYVHGMDECFEQREEDDQPFTEEGARDLVAKMAVWNREHAAEGLSSSPTTLFHFGEPETAVTR